MKRNKSQRYIKYVESIPEDKFKKIGLFQSMISKFKEHSDIKGRDTNMRMVVAKENGDLGEIELEELVCRKGDFVDAFAEGRTYQAVRMLWSDGTWEYGLKMWRNEERIYKRNGKLHPLFAKIGVINEETGKVQDLFNLEHETHVPAWILELIPMYNEKIRDAIQGQDKAVLNGKWTSLSDWEEVYKVMTSSYIVSNAKWQSIDTGKTKTKMAVSVVFDNNKWWTPRKTTWKDRFCKEKFGAISDMLEKESMKVFCYSYVKSIYSNHQKRVREYKLVPVSDILFLKRRSWNGKKRSYDYEEVWNSLDETCKGNV